MTMTTRLAVPHDAPAIADIYNEGIEDRIATFETSPRSPDDVREQLLAKADAYPTIVVQSDGVVIAFTTAGQYRSRPCYAGIAEHSVYVARSARGRGAGALALSALCDRYADLGFWKLCSRIFAENVASIRLHERCGFRIVGTYERHAQLDGVWRDCVIVERLLS